LCKVEAMWVCTDRLPFAERLLGRRASWRRVAGGDFAPEDRAVAAALLSGPEWFAGALDGDGGWKRLLVAGHAARSQFDALGSLLETGAARDRILAVAETGSEFHGWEGRRWVAAPGNLHLVAGSPVVVSAREGGPGVLIAPALALLDAIDAVPGLEGRAGIRWINDVMVDGAKVGGVIVRTRSQGLRLTDAILGIGLDVESTPQVEPDVFVPRVGALRDAAGPLVSCSLADLFGAVICALRRRLDELDAGGFLKMLAAYRRRSIVLGRQVAVYEDVPGGEEIARGTVTEITEDLGLRIGGIGAPIRRGRVVMLGEPASGV
jgi:biotin-(acetyl-CoA carboxylase) ligase